MPIPALALMALVAMEAVDVAALFLEVLLTTLFWHWSRRLNNLVFQMSDNGDRRQPFHGCSRWRWHG